MSEIKALITQMNEDFKNQPDATAAAIVETTPLAIRALADIAVGKKSTILHRMRAIDALLKLRRIVIAEDHKRQSLGLRAKTTALRHREADVAAVEARLKLIEAKTAKMAEDRKHRKDVAKALRVIAKAKKTDAA